jgi:CDGSH-type Zn-finger protein
MARIVKRDRSSPYPVTVGAETKYICGCGLSKNQPFCDGAHKVTKDESPAELYWYDVAHVRHEMDDTFPAIPVPAE